MGPGLHRGICLGSGGVVAGKGHGREYTEIRKNTDAVVFASSLRRDSGSASGRGSGMDKSWMLENEKEEAFAAMLRAWGTSRTSSPLRMGRAPDPPPTDRLCLPHPVAGQRSPVQSRLPCAQCCAVLRCAAFCSVSVSLSTTPPDFLLLNLRLLLGTTDEPVARRHSPSPIRVPVRGHADDKVFLEPIDSTSPSPLQSTSSLQQPASQTVSITSLRNTQCSIPATGAVTSQTPHTDLASIVHRPPSLRLHRPSVLSRRPLPIPKIDDIKQKLVEPVPAIARRCGPPSSGEFPCPVWTLAGPDGPPPPRFVPRRVFPQPVPPSRASSQHPATAIVCLCLLHFTLSSRSCIQKYWANLARHSLHPT